jgi:phosphonate transport system permease protein
MTAASLTALQSSFRTRRLTALAVPVLVLLYLIYIAISFDVLGLAGRAKMDNAKILLSDFVSYKTHVTRNNRDGALSVAIEGEAKGTYAPGQLPEWVTVAGDVTTIDLGRGHVVTYLPDEARYVVPDYGTIDIKSEGGKLVLSAPEPLPSWINVTDTRISVTTEQGRFA